MLFQGGLFGQEMSKEDRKFWKQKAKMYVKNPEALQAEFENFQDQIKDLKRRNRELMEQAATAQSSDLVDSLRWALIESQSENEAMQGQMEKLRRSLSTQKTVNDMGIRAGLVYRVQIGAYVFHEMQSDPGDSEDFVVERADGFNKYLIGSFRSYEEAEEFRDEVRSMGLSGAWIVPYIDGVRATIDEANQYLQRQQEQASFLD
ncbi:MAG: hypothetical protein D6722_10240 [Bacteroidetes bacterium]|nr:MAG: hypothetical protein D6722_10240 [Bacteroidota bacterium]